MTLIDVRIGFEDKSDSWSVRLGFLGLCCGACKTLRGSWSLFALCEWFGYHRWSKHFQYGEPPWYGC